MKATRTKQLTMVKLRRSTTRQYSLEQVNSKKVVDHAGLAIMIKHGRDRPRQTTSPATHQLVNPANKRAQDLQDSTGIWPIL